MSIKIKCFKDDYGIQFDPRMVEDDPELVSPVDIVVEDGAIVSPENLEIDEELEQYLLNKARVVEKLQKESTLSQEELDLFLTFGPAFDEE